MAVTQPQIFLLMIFPCDGCVRIQGSRPLSTFDELSHPLKEHFEYWGWKITNDGNIYYIINI